MDNIISVIIALATTGIIVGVIAIKDYIKDKKHYDWQEPKYKR